VQVEEVAVGLVAPRRLAVGFEPPDPEEAIGARRAEPWAVRPRVSQPADPVARSARAAVARGARSSPGKSQRWQRPIRAEGAPQATRARHRQPAPAPRRSLLPVPRRGPPL